MTMELFKDIKNVVYVIVVIHNGSNDIIGFV